MEFSALAGRHNGKGQRRQDGRLNVNIEAKSFLLAVTLIANSFSALCYHDRVWKVDENRLGLTEHLAL